MSKQFSLFYIEYKEKDRAHTKCLGFQCQNSKKNATTDTKTQEKLIPMCSESYK